LEWQLGPNFITWWPAGAHLAALFGSRYSVIASAVGVSDANGLGQPEAGSLEARLTASTKQALFIPTYLGQGLPASQIAALPTRSGAVRNSTYGALGPASFADFDWLVFLPSTAYTRGGPPLP
jgi:hypothetical protein